MRKSPADGAPSYRRPFSRTRKRSSSDILRTRPLADTTTVSSSPFCWVTKTLRTSVCSSSSDSTKNTQLPPADSRNCPAATLEMSWRCSKRDWYSPLCTLAQGAMTSDRSPTSTANGSANPITGLTQEAMLRPLACQMTISESRHARVNAIRTAQRSEEHTSELQSRENLVCRLLL